MGEKKSYIKPKAKILIYLSHFLTAWDASVWEFALGIFLIEITPNSLQFSASYGLAAGGSVLLFGTVVGDWVDFSPRLSVVRTATVVQNISLIMCALVIYVLLTFKEEVRTALPDEWVLKIGYAVIVVVAVISILTSLARQTAIERDWVVEICHKEKDLLATLTATMRRISLATMVIAPIVTGLIMTNISQGMSAIVIAVWNFFTIFVEYYLLWKVYMEIPELQREKVEVEELQTRLEKVDGIESATGLPMLAEHQVVELGQTDSTQTAAQHSGSRPVSWRRLFTSCITLYRGWKTYRKYDVFFAGLSLAALYFTVLTFHWTTTGFAYSQGLSESLIGGLHGAAACVGIVGTIAYPIFRRKFGLQRTGLYAVGAEIISLTLCVVSVWAPGSPFDPYYFTRETTDGTLEQPCFQRFPDNTVSSSSSATTTLYGVNSETITLANNGTFLNMSISALRMNENVLETNATDCIEKLAKSTISSYASVSLLLAGIIGGRFGLWMADLTITQLFLETVHVTERGIVNGVQNAINQFVEMVKFAVVIGLPKPEVFGYLVIISYCFICFSWILLAVYVKQKRGYLFPCSANDVGHSK